MITISEISALIFLEKKSVVGMIVWKVVDCTITIKRIGVRGEY